MIAKIPSFWEYHRNLGIPRKHWFWGSRFDGSWILVLGPFGRSQKQGFRGGWRGTKHYKIWWVSPLFWYPYQHFFALFTLSETSKKDPKMRSQKSVKIEVSGDAKSGFFGVFGKTWVFDQKSQNPYWIPIRPCQDPDRLSDDLEKILRTEREFARRVERTSFCEEILPRSYQLSLILFYEDN